MPASISVCVWGGVLATCHVGRIDGCLAVSVMNGAFHFALLDEETGLAWLP